MADDPNFDLDQLIGSIPVTPEIEALFRGGSGTAGRVNTDFFVPFQQRIALGESQRVGDSDASLKNFIQQFNRANEMSKALELLAPKE